MSDADTQSGSRDLASVLADPIYHIVEFPLHFMAAVQRRNQQNMATALRPMGVDPQEWRILATLRERDRQSISELAEIAVLERTRASRIVDSMVERGLVQRFVDNGDRRYALVGLTPAGREKYQEI